MEAFDFHAFDLARDDHPDLFAFVCECEGDLPRNLQAEVLSKITGHVLPDDFEVSIIPNDEDRGDIITLSVLRDVGTGLIPTSPVGTVVSLPRRNTLLRSHLTVGWEEARNLETAAAGVTDTTFDSRFTAGRLVDWFSQPLPLLTSEPHPAGKNVILMSPGLPWPSYVLNALTIALGWKDEIRYRMAVEAVRLKDDGLTAAQIVERVGLTPGRFPDKQLRELCKRALPDASSKLALRRHKDRARVSAIAATWFVEGDVLQAIANAVAMADQQCHIDLKVGVWSDESRLLLVYAARWFSERADPQPEELRLALLRALRLANSRGLTDTVKQHLDGGHLDLDGLEAVAKEVGSEWASGSFGLSDYFQASRTFRPASINATAKAYKGIEDDGVASHHRTLRRWMEKDRKDRVYAIQAYRIWRALAHRSLAITSMTELAPLCILVAAQWRLAAIHTAWARKVRGHAILSQWHAGGKRSARERARYDLDLYRRTIEAGIDPHDVVKAERKGIDPLEYIASRSAH